MGTLWIIFIVYAAVLACLNGRSVIGWACLAALSGPVAVIVLCNLRPTGGTKIY